MPTAPPIGQMVVDFRSYGGNPSVPASYVDCAPAFKTAMSAMSSGDILFFPYDPTQLDASGICNYCIAAPLEWTKEIGLLAESKRVQIRCVGTNWGNSGIGYKHAVRNWAVSDAGADTSTEKAPDVTASPTQQLMFRALDGAGFNIGLNTVSGVSALSLVHPHEQSRIEVVVNGGGGGSYPNPQPFTWGNRALSIFTNNDSTGGANGVAAGPLYFSVGAYGQGFDHIIYGDGTNGGTNTKWIQDLHLENWYSAPNYNGAAAWKNCVKSPVKLRACNRVTHDDFHIECFPWNAPPTLGAGLWAPSAPYQVGDKVVVQTTGGGANQGLGMLMVCKVAGTTAASAPAWPTPNGTNTQTVVDGTVTWAVQPMGLGTGGNGHNGLLDAALPWPGAAATVPLGTTISPDGTHGWMAVNHNGVTAAVAPTFSTAGGRGSQVTDGTVIWQYVVDDFNQAIFRGTDVAQEGWNGGTVAASVPTNQPIRYHDRTGTAPYDVFQKIPDVQALSLMGPSGTLAAGVPGVGKNGWYGPIFVDAPSFKLSYSSIFDPRHFISADAFDVRYLQGAGYVPTVLPV